MISSTECRVAATFMDLKPGVVSRFSLLSSALQALSEVPAQGKSEKRSGHESGIGVDC